MKYNLPICLIAAFCAAPALAAPYEGRWAQEVDWCANTRDSGTDQVPVEITATEIHFYEGDCEIAAIEDIGVWDTAWRADLVCRSEGETFDLEMIMAIGGGEQGSPPRFLTQIHLDEGFVQILYACR